MLHIAEGGNFQQSISLLCKLHFESTVSFRIYIVIFGTVFCSKKGQSLWISGAD